MLELDSGSAQLKYKSISYNNSYQIKYNQHIYYNGFPVAKSYEQTLLNNKQT